MKGHETRLRSRRQIKQFVRTLYFGLLMACLMLIPVVMLKQCISPPTGDDMAVSARPAPAPIANVPAMPDHLGETIPEPDPDDPPDSDTIRPPEVAASIRADTDRGPQQLRLSERRCRTLHASFQARIIGDGRCEVWIHELARQDGAIWLTASPRHGVMDNGRPVVAMLPEAALP